MKSLRDMPPRGAFGEEERGFTAVCVDRPYSVNSELERVEVHNDPHLRLAETLSTDWTWWY